MSEIIELLKKIKNEDINYYMENGHFMLTTETRKAIEKQIRKGDK